MALNFQAFMDESESKEEFVLGGHIAPAETWAKFAKDWEELLPFGTRAKNGKLHFKMSEMARSPEGMSRVPHFYSVIEKYDLLPLSFRMNLGDFKRAQERMALLAKTLQWTIHWEKWTNPYFFCFRILINEFHRKRPDFEARLPVTEKIDFIFDDKSEKTTILAAWDEASEKLPEEIRVHLGATPRFENDQDFLGLQAADLWAWWVRDWCEEDASDVPDKLKGFDFGSWRGRKRGLIVFSMNEDAILDRLQALAVESLVDGDLDPISLARLRDAS